MFQAEIHTWITVVIRISIPPKKLVTPFEFKPFKNIDFRGVGDIFMRHEGFVQALPVY